MTDLPEWALPIRDEMAEEIDKWIGDMSTSPDIATAALAVALPLIAEHMAAMPVMMPDDADDEAAVKYYRDAIRDEVSNPFPYAP